MLTLVISDSIGKKLWRSPHFRVEAQGGYSAWALLEDICRGKFDKALESIARVNLLVGTNDVPITTPLNLVTVLISCAQALVARKRDLEVSICGLLPRPQYNGLYQAAIKTVNKCLGVACKINGFPYLKVFKPFLYKGGIRPDYFTDDQLHPSRKGLKALFNALSTQCQQRYPKNLCPLHLFKGPEDPLSNFFPCDIRHNGRLSAHVEQAYQIEKAIFNGNCYQRLALTKTLDPYICKQLGAKITTNKQWETRKVECMQELLQEKASLAAYRRALTRDTRAIFVEDTNNQVWAKGGVSNTGKNTLGCLHVLVRCMVLVGRVSA